jgi:hypothetical protein
VKAIKMLQAPANIIMTLQPSPLSMMLWKYINRLWSNVWDGKILTMGPRTGPSDTPAVKRLVATTRDHTYARDPKSVGVLAKKNENASSTHRYNLSMVPRRRRQPKIG